MFNFNHRDIFDDLSFHYCIYNNIKMPINALNTSKSWIFYFHDVLFVCNLSIHYCIYKGNKMPLYPYKT